jgi:hypothetical protein
MIRIDYEEFTIDVPIERRMTVEQFLSVADRLERIAGRVHAPASPTYAPAHQPAAHAHASAAHTPHSSHYDFDEHDGQHVFGVHPPTGASAHAPLGVHHDAHGHDDFRFEHEDAERLEYFMDKLARQLAKLEETHTRLERIEKTMLQHGIHAGRS